MKVGASNMLINGKQYDDPDELLARGEHDLNRNYLLQDIYKAYVAFRSILGGRSCNKMKFVRLQELIKDPENVQKITETLVNYTPESVNYIVAKAKEYIPFVK